MGKGCVTALKCSDAGVGCFHWLEVSGVFHTLVFRTIILDKNGQLLFGCGYKVNTTKSRLQGDYTQYAE